MSYALQDAVWEMTDLKGPAKMVLLRLAHYARDITDTPYPSIETLSTYTGFCKRTVTSALIELQRLGLIRAVTGHGKGGRAKTTRWLLILETKQEMRGIDAQETAQEMLGKADTAQDMRGFRIETTQFVTQYQAGAAYEPIREKVREEGRKKEPPYIPPLPVVVDVTPEPVVCEAPAPAGMSVTVVSKPQGSRKVPVVPGGFPEFYAAYPVKKGKDAAERAYASALKRTTHAEIMEGLSRFNAELARKPTSFVKHPATWLNAGCWADEPAPDTGPRMGSNGKPMTEFNAMFLDRIEEAQRRNQR